MAILNWPYLSNMHWWGRDRSRLSDLRVTETSAIANLQQARAFADRMHRCGCRFALDNFGAGLASFYYLKNFPFDYLKIDGEFIRRLSLNPIDQLVVKAIVCIAQGMGKKTIAEFVADANAVCLLRDSGVDYAQGYHIGLPQPVAEYLQHPPELTGKPPSV